MRSDYSEYVFRDGQLNFSHAYLLPVVKSVVSSSGPLRIIDIGCGNGAVTHYLSRLGHQVIGIDASVSGIDQARAAYPGITFDSMSVYDDLHSRHGRFDVVVSLEVVEHLYAPKRFMTVVHDALEPGGIAILSTPYHGYMKNLALAVSGKLDAHFTALWEGGHIKFWSVATLTTLIENAGLVVERVFRVGRIPMLAKSMILVARKPPSTLKNTTSGAPSG